MIEGPSGDYAELESLKLEAFQREQAAGSRAAERQQAAALALLVKWTLEDEEWPEEIRKGLNNACFSRDSYRDPLEVRAQKLEPVAHELGLHPLILALACEDYREEADEGGTGASGSDDWYSFGENILDLRRRTAQRVKGLSSEALTCITKLSADPLVATEMAVARADEILQSVRKLEREVRNAMGGLRKPFYHCTQRDLRGFYLKKMRKRGARDPEILALFVERGEETQNKDDQAGIVRRSSDRAGAVQEAMDKILEGVEGPRKKRQYKKQAPNAQERC